MKTLDTKPQTNGMYAYCLVYIRATAFDAAVATAALQKAGCSSSAEAAQPPPMRWGCRQHWRDSPCEMEKPRERRGHRQLVDPVLHRTLVPALSRVCIYI